SIRRECLDHILVLGGRHLRHILTRYFAYYHQARTHLAVDKDAPDLRPIQSSPAGQIVRLPEGGGLHPRYLRLAASSTSSVLCHPRARTSPVSRDLPALEPLSRSTTRNRCSENPDGLPRSRLTYLARPRMFPRVSAEVLAKDGIIRLRDWLAL